MNTLYLVIPCYNEEAVLKTTKEACYSVLGPLCEAGKISKESKILFVDDGSLDDTWQKIEKLHNENAIFCGLKLSRNRGHQNALLAGLMVAKEKADMVVTMDADLQDDVKAISEMVDKYLAGADIVYGVRSDRQKDSFFKKTTAEGFYKFMNRMGTETVFNHADYRLMSKRALEALAEFKEVNLFLRGIVPQLGFKTDVVYYERNERVAGESKYNLRKMLALAWDGISSFSTKPIAWIHRIGGLALLASLVVLIIGATGHTLTDTTSCCSWIMVSVWAATGLILTSIGLVGEYVGKIYIETKARPRYIIEKELLPEENND